MLRALKNFLVNWFIRLSRPGVKIGRGVAISWGSFLSGQIILNKKVQLFDYVRLAGQVKIGDNSYLNYFSQVYASATSSVSIGKYCSIAQQVVIVASNDHFSERLTTAPIGRVFAGLVGGDGGASVRIGNDVWIGVGVVILPGVNIGDGAIIGAGSVVPQGTSIGAYEVWAGSPARKIKDRFSEDIREKLQDLKWWNWNKQILDKNRNLFTKDIDKEWFNQVKTSVDKS
jgi:acetyltransferase-like isoleucine patch superfamily enzyme